MIYVPFIFFVVFFMYMYKKKRHFETGSIITLFFIITSFFSIILKQGNLWTYSASFPQLDILPTILYLGLLTISIMPFYNVNSHQIKRISLYNPKRFTFVCWGLIVLSFVSAISSFQDISTVLQQSFLDTRKEFYADMGEIKEYGDLPWYQYLINFAPFFSPLMILFFFYSIIYTDNKWYFNTLLIIASLINSFEGMLTASRTPVVCWIMTFIALYVFFGPQMENTIKKKVNFLATVLGAICVFYIMLVSISRWGDRSSGVQGGLVVYAGQTYPQFCHVYDHYTYDGVTWNRIMPITSKFIWKEKFNNHVYREEVSHRIGAETGVFFTFLGDAMLDFGKVGMVIYTLVFVLLARHFLRRPRRDTVSLSWMIIFVLLMRQILLGLFAYVYCSVSSSIMIIGGIGIALFLNGNKTPKRLK